MFKKVAIIGAGTMGSGIAQWFCQQGVKTLLIDLDQDFLKKQQTNVFSSWDKLLAKDKFDKNQTEAFKKSLSIGDINDIDHEFELVLEAIIENIDIKKELFKNLESKISPKCLLASNTSSISISALSSSLSPGVKKRFFGMHFFNPAPIMKLVELIHGHWSCEKTIEEVKAWFLDKNKKIAVCKDSPGFIVNRVARNFYGEALRIPGTFNRESFQEIDEVLTKVGGFRMGPFELMDLIGVDINYDVTNTVWDAYFKEPRFAPHPLQRQLVESNRLGKKTGEGFYEYT